MRAAPFISLLIPAVLGAGLGGLLVSCHKERLPQAKAAASAPAHVLKVESYTPAIPKAPVEGPKLETSLPHPPEAVQVAKPVAAPPVARRPRPPLQTETYAPPPRPYGQPFRRVFYADPQSGRYVEAPGYSPYAPGDPRVETAPEPSGFRLNAKICRTAARQGDPLAETPECQGILAAARQQLEACQRAFEIGDDRVAMSAECRQAAMGR